MQDDGGQRWQGIQLGETLPETLLELDRVALGSGLLILLALQARGDQLLQRSLASGERHFPGADEDVFKLRTFFALLLRDVAGEQQEKGNGALGAEHGNGAAGAHCLPLNDDNATDRLTALPDDSGNPCVVVLNLGGQTVLVAQKQLEKLRESLLRLARLLDDEPQFL